MYTQLKKPRMDLDKTPTPVKSVEIETPTHTHTTAELRPHLPPSTGYKECMKNHAASIGGHAVDGCGEYMHAPSLTCAACGCHRNFHRREPGAAITPPFLDFRRPMLLEHRQEPATPTVCRKRFRTKFGQEQKEKMRSFSEKLGWKIHKSDEAEVAEFSRMVGVSKGVLKVWMHNNKNTKRESINGGDLIKIEEIRESDDNDSHFRNGSTGDGLHFHHSNNASSSSALSM